jgi:phosphoribosylaminoimidazole-succinocarboxamide synthase
MTRNPVLTTEIPGLPKTASGKVRDIYDLGQYLLLVASDRISAFDVIMPNGIPDKGRVLTQISHFWFGYLADITPCHEVSTEIDAIAEALEQEGATVTPEVREMLEGRSMLCVKGQALPIECVVRGYLAGSLWKEYCQAGGKTQSVRLHGYDFAAGMEECERLPQPIFTPATKATTGHDENISVAQAAQILQEGGYGEGEQLAQTLAEKSIALYNRASERALQNGILIADTKFEFGLLDGKLLWIDEALSPDSSRFWEKAIYSPGSSQPSFDKQYVRDWLEASGWGKTPPAPMLPEEVVAGTADRYREAYRRIVGNPLP